MIVGCSGFGLRELSGAVEALGLAVLPGAVRADGEVACADVGEGFLEVEGERVAAGVVGDDLADRDAVAGEEQSGPEQEARVGGSGLVREDLGVGQAGVVVDGDVDVVEADLRASIAPARRWQRGRVLASRSCCALLSTTVSFAVGCHKSDGHQPAWGAWIAMASPFDLATQCVGTGCRDSAP